jgi:hypothetical protein
MSNLSTARILAPYGFWKTQEQWEDETGLTRYEQEGARGKQRECDFWQGKRRGVPAKMYFHVDEYILDEAVDAWIEQHTEEREQQRSTARKTGKPLSKKGTKQQSSLGKSTILDTVKSPDILYIESTSESTAQNTPKTTNARGAAKQKLTQHKHATKEAQYESGDVTEAFDRLNTIHTGYFGTHSF